MSYQHIVVPTEGEKITCLGDAQCVPDHPIIAFIEGDGIGRDIMTASKRIWDAAVEKAYGGAPDRLDGDLRRGEGCRAV